jgi:hypothetical protein
VNRIILIGNGFDLAHGLETSYKHFIDWFWMEEINKINKHNRISEYDDKFIKIPFLPSTIYLTSDSKNWIDIIRDNCSSFQCKNKFLKLITDNLALKNWVDVEEEYNRQLHAIATVKGEYEDIDILNKDFSAIKNAFISYLNYISTKNNNQTFENIRSIIYSNLDLNDFTKIGVNDIVDEEYEKLHQIIANNNETSIQNLDDDTYRLIKDLKASNIPINKEEIRKILADKTNCFYGYLYLMPKQLLFLNFNYTNTESRYYNYPISMRKIETEREIIHIHGELNDEDNPIIFGYGDEISDKYKELEDKNDNRLLENIKSTKYLETDNYKRLLSFIDSDKYQIFIMGHSCGLSDRTLLNKLFEHENCVSIKTFYHKKEDKTDDYSDKVRNISRNFKDKTIMREKVVNKTYCEPLCK